MCRGVMKDAPAPTNDTLKIVFWTVLAKSLGQRFCPANSSFCPDVSRWTIDFIDRIFAKFGVLSG